MDSEQEAMTVDTPQVSYKINPQRVPPDSLDPATWLKHSTDNMAAAEESIKTSQALRDDMCLTIQVIFCSINKV